MGVEVAARTCSSFIASRMVDSSERAQSVTALLCDTSAEEAEASAVAAADDADADADATATA